MHEHVTLSGLDGPFLPVIGRPVSVDAGGDEVGFDPGVGHAGAHVVVAAGDQL